MAGNDEPIQRDWTIHKVLERYPDLLDDLVAMSPAFGKLRNPLMRKVQSRLVTVEQAARIGGIAPDLLVARLNRAAGVTVSGPVSCTTAGSPPEPPAPDWLDTAEVTRLLDVRPIMVQGEEPFRKVMATARDVQPGEVFRLLAGFEPVPLYDTLAKQGFSHWSRQLAPEYWQVDFRRDPERPVQTVTSPIAAGVDWDVADAEVTIDVSELVPPEPMVKILEALATLSEGSTLLVHHVRRPIHLYERLDEMGYPHQTRDLGPDRVVVLIRKPPRRGEAA